MIKGGCLSDPEDLICADQIDPPRYCTCPKCGKTHQHLKAGVPPHVEDVGDLCQCPSCGRMHKRPEHPWD